MLRSRQISNKVRSSGVLHLMPKKQTNPLHIRPSSNPHPSLSLSKSPAATESFRGLEEKYSVADCLRISRSEEARRSTLRPPPVATLHPSLRNLLDIPEALQPRPRAGVRTVAPLRTLRVPGPATPPSWQLSTSRHGPRVGQTNDMGALKEPAQGQVKEQVILPGVPFPRKGVFYIQS